MNDTGFENYQSPFSWRYGSDDMRHIFSERHKYEIWRKIWIALAQVEQEAGLVSKQELKDLVLQEKNINIQRILELEKETKHDVVAAIREFAEKAPIGGKKVHLGATSMDIVDNADAYRYHEAVCLIYGRVKEVLIAFSEKILTYAETPCVGYTHLQPAEPTTVGYRLAFYAQDLLCAMEFLLFAKKQLKAKGMKGAVGTAASYKELLENSGIDVATFEKKVMKLLGLDYCIVSSQVYPRQFDYILLSALTAISSSVAKFAGDLRILQSPNFGEWSEPFAEKQVGSSAMPFKKNPIACENICSLARFVAALPQVAIQNSALSNLERTLDDSANKRIIMPDAFLATDQVLISARKIISGLVVHEKRIQSNVSLYASFSMTESILLESVQNGADRLHIYDILRAMALTSWSETQKGKPNPMQQLLYKNREIRAYVKKPLMKKLMNIRRHIGDSAERALKIVKIIRSMD